jgi:hypothetical protein
MKEMKPTLIPEAAHISCTPEEFEAGLRNLQLKKFEEKFDRAAATVKSFCKKTVERYRQLFKKTNNLDEGKALYLTDSRATAQTSMRNAVAYAVTVVESCFVENPNGPLRTARRVTDDGNGVMTARDLYAGAGAGSSS